MHGIGRTVFTGSQIADFDVEILGVLEKYRAKGISWSSRRLSGGVAGAHRRNARHERQPRLHRRQTDRRGGDGVSVFRNLILSAGIRPIEDMPARPGPAACRSPASRPRHHAGSRAGGTRPDARNIPASGAGAGGRCAHDGYRHADFLGGGLHARRSTRSRRNSARSVLNRARASRRRRHRKCNRVKMGNPAGWNHRMLHDQRTTDGRRYGRGGRRHGHLR